MPTRVAPHWAAWNLRLGNPPGPHRGPSGGGVASDPVSIPVTWLSQPLTLRLQQPITHAEVTQTDGSTARADSSTLATYGVFPFTATLSTAVDADATNLAHWTVTYNSTPRMISPTIVVNLLYRSDDEKWTLLNIGRGRRIRITGLPTQWPTGADTLVVRGIRHETTEFGRILVWVTEPVIGLSPSVYDIFAREIVNDWDAATSGQTWSTTGGVASDFSVSGGLGQQLHTAAGSLKGNVVESLSTDWDQYVDLSWPVNSATGGGLTRWVCGRYSDANNYYACRLNLTTGGTVAMGLFSRINGSLATLVSETTLAASYTAGTLWRAHFQGVGSTLRASAWNASTTQPTTWTMTTTEPSLTAGTSIALLSRAEAGNTNVPITLPWSNLADYIGANPQGVAGPWFRWGSSSWGGTDSRPF